MAIHVSPLSGYTSITNFLLSSDAQVTFGLGLSGTDWSLGDGTVVRSLTNTQYNIFNKPGIYKITLLDKNTYSAYVSVFNYLPESLGFETITTTSSPGLSTTLVINLTSNSTDQQNINLYAVNSNSYPYNEIGLWSHLNPQWKFIDSNGNVTNKIAASTTNVYYNSALGISFNPADILIGTTAQVTAFYVDDLPSPSSGIRIIATKEIGDTINSRISATTTAMISAGLPSKLSITIDGIQPLLPYYWQNSTILHTVCLSNNAMVKFLPLANNAPITVSRYFLTDTDITSSFTSNTLNFSALSSDGFTHIRGYIRDLSVPSITANNVRISAVATLSVNYDALSAYNFFTPITGIQMATLTGVSTYFNILSSTQNQFRRFNESENFGCLMKDFVNAPTFKDSTIFFDQYFNVIAGAEPIDDQQLGLKILEKIGNFAKNHSDLDVSNLEQFLSLAKQIDMPIEDFGLKYPERLKRIMDVASIDHKKIWGTRCVCNENFGCSNCCNNICKLCGKDFGQNLGEELSISTAVISVGTPVVLRYMQRDPDKYELYYPKAIGALTAYSLSSLTATNLLTPLSSYYKFYTYISTPAGNQIEGIINWDDEHTILTESLSTAENWYGDNQILDELFNLELRKGLGLLGQ